MKNIKVHLGKRSYTITIASQGLQSFDFRLFQASTYIIITDSVVKRLYGSALKKRLSKQGLKTILLEFSSSERNKTMQTVLSIGRQMARAHIDRDALVIALGGGIVGDISSFVASIYKRGIRYVHVPTTLLAQLDSSIGGKTGVNIPEGKNLLGTIYQPQRVFIDLSLLKNLPQNQINSGLAEVIKYGVIGDIKLFRYLENNIRKRDEKFYYDIVRRSCITVADIIEQDEREEALRKVLNYGHTVGHAIEILTHYTVSHGEAVALGMVFEGKIAYKLGIWKEEEWNRQNNLIKAAGLPLSLSMNSHRLLEIMKMDKKSKNGQPFFILPNRIGSVKQEGRKVAFSVPSALVRECIKK